MKRLAIPLLAALTAVALAASLQDATDLYTKGDFTGAATMAASLKTADGYALAAKSTSIYAQTRPEKEQEALYNKAQDYAEKAVAADPNNANAYIERARALGRLSQLQGVLQALVKGYGGRVRDDLNKAMKLDPNNATVYVSLGLWHAEISSKGVGWMYGADAGQVAPNFEKAIKLEPNVPIHRIEYAHALVLLDRNKNKDKAKQLLQSALNLKPRDAADRLDLERAKRDLAALN
ncbi:MAG TPA: hypothetical protein VHN99_00400 [Deinococcales bacterium]|nr:hypothetical protein [Deinococcales bacterium]